MKVERYNSFVESLARTDSSLLKLKRTNELNGADFLEIFNDNCKNFSFDNPQLWRSKTKKYSLELFKPAPRNANPLAFKDFFDEIEGNINEYPVVRKNSLIGGTNRDMCKLLAGEDMYVVIPFDNTEIVFCPVMDLWALSDDKSNRTGSNMLVNGIPISKDNFTKVIYDKNFKIPYKGRLTKKYGDAGCEFFLSSPCLLLHESKIDWLKKNI
jgi:hypothetical protein